MLILHLNPSLAIIPNSIIQGRLCRRTLSNRAYLRVRAHYFRVLRSSTLNIAGRMHGYIVLGGI